MSGNNGCPNDENDYELGLREGRRLEREACAAYCLDRADQYDTNSGTWVGLADAAEGIAKGEASGMLERGETEDLLARVRKLAGLGRATRKARDR
jgi:hypothetical protein